MKFIAIALLAAALPTADDRELERLLRQSAYPLTEALAKALEAAKGGVVLNAELEDEDGKAVYSVDVAVENKTVEVVLDAKTGELLKKDIEDDNQSRLAKACKVTLAQAIGTSLQKVAGKVYAAEAEFEDDRAVLEVKILGDGKVHKVKVDAASGEVLKVKSRNVEGEKK